MPYYGMPDNFFHNRLQYVYSISSKINFYSTRGLNGAACGFSQNAVFGLDGRAPNRGAQTWCQNLGNVFAHILTGIRSCVSHPVMVKNLNNRFRVCRRPCSRIRRIAVFGFSEPPSKMNIRKWPSFLPKT